MRSARRCCPTSSHIRDRFEARRSQRRGTLDRLVARTDRSRPEAGAVPARRAIRGRRRGGRRTQSPSTPCGADRRHCPREAEMADPAAWVRRVVSQRIGGLGIARRVARQAMAPETAHPGKRSGGRPRRSARGDRPVAHPVGALQARSTWRASQTAAPGSRLVSVSLEGLADGDLSDVEVLLRGPLPQRIFDRLLGRCPRLMWVHSATAGVERVLTPVALERGIAITNARGVFSGPDRQVRADDNYRRQPPAAAVARAAARARIWQPLEAREMADVTVGIVGLGSIGRRVAELALTFGASVIATRRQLDAEDRAGGRCRGPAAGAAARADEPQRLHRPRPATDVGHRGHV